MADSNLRFRRNGIHAFVRVRQHGHIGKFGQEVGNWLVELHLAFVNKQHCSNAGDRLRHGVDAPERVDINRRWFALPLRADGNDIR